MFVAVNPTRHSPLHKRRRNLEWINARSSKVAAARAVHAQSPWMALSTSGVLSQLEGIREPMRVSMRPVVHELGDLDQVRGVGN